MKFTRFSFLLLCFVATSFAGAAQSNIYMRVMDPGQINGESQGAGYLTWTEINAFNAGSTLPNVSFTQGTGRPDSKCFTISMFQDKMAYYLKRKLFVGSTLTSIQLDFTRTNGTNPAFVYYRVQMENVYVTAIEEATTQGSGGVTMNVSFVPARFRYTYTPQNPNGTFGTPTIFGWDVTTNTIW